MKLKLRKYQDYAFVELEESGVTIDFGTLDNSAAKKLLEQFKDAVDELEWFDCTDIRSRKR